MLSFIQRQLNRVSSTSTLVTRKRLRDRLRNRSHEHSLSLAIERLEPRVLLAGFDLGDITNPASLRTVNDQVPTVIQFNPDNSQSNADVYRFSLPRPAVVIAALSDLQRTNLFDDTGAALGIFSIDELTGDKTALARKEYPEGTTGDIRVSLPSGEYSIFVGFGNDRPFLVDDDVKSLLKSYDLSIHADTAPVDFTSGNPRATEGRNLGPLSTATGTDIQEYVGIGGGGSPVPVQDQVDMFLFDLVKQGGVEVKVTSGVLASGSMDFTLFRDANGNGVFDSGSSLEKLETKTEITSGATKIVSRILGSGRYGIAVFVTPSTSNVGQADNYRLRTTYTVVDGAGNSTATARDIGTLDNPIRTFSDYLSPVDTVDIYKFTTVEIGAFVFESLLTDVILPGTNFVLDLVRASDNGVIFHDVPAGRETAAPLTVPGTYFVKVRRISGEGPYTLSMSNRNTDLAGNTMDGAAKNLGNFVFKELADQVSAFDTLDFYKFEIAVQSDFDVAMTGMPAGTNAGLRLIRSNNGDSVIDPGEVLASSNNAGNAPEFIGRTLTPGVYFVLVERIAGAPTYHLRLVHDRVGNILANAQPISQGGGSNLEFLGPEDDTDVYKFTLGTTRQVGVKVELNNEPLLIRLGQDTNGNGLLDQAEERLSKTVGAGTGGFERITLTGGVANFLIVNALIQDEGTLYRVTLFNAKPDGAGNSLTDARDIGTLGDPQVFSDPLGRGPIVQMDDLNDFYKFKLGDNGPFQFVSQFSNVAGIVVFRLIRDDNLNQRIDSGEVLTAVASPVANVPPPPISIRLDVRGTYYLNAFSTNTAAYTVNMRVISLDTAGNSLSSVPPPLDLGPLVNTINSPNHFVGAIDRDDFFRFSVANPGELVASLSGAPNTAYQVIRDIDRDGVVDSGEALAGAFGSRPLHGVILPAADDNYFVRVKGIFGDSLYTLNLTFSNQMPFLTPFLISATVPTEIKAVRFDKGGEGIAYHDTTVDNNGNQPGFRSDENIDVDVSTTGDPESGGRRVTNTAPGEFLEYTLNVAASGQYDFDARVACPDLGATFHIEIDGASIAPPVAVPDTNGADNMVTVVAASNVNLAAGPHILRLVIDTGTGVINSSASFNFVTVRPASAGTFALTPPHTTVAAYQHTNLALAWTVPVGGWRTLKQVDLQLRDDNGRLIWIRFDESTNSMSLYNQITGKFETPKEVGSYGVLRSPLANVYMKTTTIAANGPGDPTVVITFDIKFKASARGHWTVEAAASDDLGHNDPFMFAGTLDVV